jgi:hypothetical protein
MKAQMRRVGGIKFRTLAVACAASLSLSAFAMTPAVSASAAPFPRCNRVVVTHGGTIVRVTFPSTEIKKYIPRSTGTGLMYSLNATTGKTKQSGAGYYNGADTIFYGDSGDLISVTLTSPAARVTYCGGGTPYRVP